MWMAWTVCCLSKHRCLTADRNRMRSQTPPTHFHTVIRCVLTLLLCNSRSFYTTSSLCLCLVPAYTGVFVVIHSQTKKLQYWRLRCSINSVVFARQSWDYDWSQSSRRSCVSLAPERHWFGFLQMGKIIQQFWAISQTSIRICVMLQNCLLISND